MRKGIPRRLPIGVGFTAAKILRSPPFLSISRSPRRKHAYAPSDLRPRLNTEYHVETSPTPPPFVRLSSPARLGAMPRSSAKGGFLSRRTRRLLEFDVNSRPLRTSVLRADGNSAPNGLSLQLRAAFIYSHLYSELRSDPEAGREAPRKKGPRRMCESLVKFSSSGHDIPGMALAPFRTGEHMHGSPRQAQPRSPPTGARVSSTSLKREILQPEKLRRPYGG